MKEEKDRSRQEHAPLDAPLVSYEACFSDPRAAVAGVGAYLQECLAHAPDDEALHRLRLAVHEWIANLDRHARFEEGPPKLRVRIWQRGARFLCTIEDNARGFDLEAHLAEQPTLAEHASTLPTEGGLGLLLLQASAEQMAYDTTISGAHDPAAGLHNRLRLAVRSRSASPEEQEPEVAAHDFS